MIYVMTNRSEVAGMLTPKNRGILKKVAVGVCVFVVAYAVISAILKSVERNRNYVIDVNSEYNFACNLTYDATQDKFSCAKHTIDGAYSSYSTTELHSSESSMSTSGDEFSIKLPIVEISADNYETDSYSHDAITKKFGKTTVDLSIYNSYLDEDVANKTVTINWQFSDSDLAMIDTKNAEWKAAEEQKKAEAEAARIAAEQAEAQRKAEEAKKAAEAAAQQTAQQLQSVQYYSNGGSSESTSSTSSGANTSTHTPSTTQSSGVYYQNCDAVRAAGKAPLYRGQPGYSTKLDRDKDGIACE